MPPPPPPAEAMHPLLKYNMHELSHVIYRLPVHNENEQNIYFKDGCENEVINKNLSTPLTAWFELNKNDEVAHQYLYLDIPNYYIKKKNKQTKNGCKRFNFI